MIFDEHISGLLFVGCMILLAWGAIVLVRGMFIEPVSSNSPLQQPNELPKAFPKSPAAMAAFPVAIVGDEFNYLLKLLSDFQPSTQQASSYGRDQAPRGTANYDNAIQPFREHVMRAIDKHNSDIARHNAEVSKFISDAAEYAVDLERRAKRV